MKNNVIIASFLCFITFAGFSQGTEEEMRVLREYFNQEKKATVADFMNLETEHEVAFWTVYEAYEQERRKFGTQRIKAISAYAEAYPNVTNEQVDAWMKELNQRKLDEVKLQKKYYKILAKETSPVIALQYLQIDAYIRAVVDLQLLEGMPFIGEN